MKRPRYDLLFDAQLQRWSLVHVSRGQSLKVFGSKRAALRRGSLDLAVGGQGIVRIRKKDGKIQEVRTYPRSVDPRERG